MTQEKPKLKKDKNKPLSLSTPAREQNQDERCEDKVPWMFRAQVEGRCQLQRVLDKKNGQSDAQEWAKEWTELYSHSEQTATATSSQPSPGKVDPFARPPKPTSPAKPIKVPEFGAGVETQIYQMHWRLVSNSGQDDGIIRPVIGASGYPYFPGSSMKGAFRRACNPAQRERYCGTARSKEQLAKSPEGTPATEPGILRFHGGYPVDNSWTKNLVDIVHPQENKQVIDNSTTGAKAQISLHRVKMRFGISCARTLEESEWREIWQIWERALAEGIGGRVSAGYGRFEVSASPSPLLEVHLQGRGVASTLLDTNREFRPNMFKAALRGHTLRLLGGMTDAATAQRLTKVLWGGIANDESTDGNGAIEGCLSVAFEYRDNPEIFKQYRNTWIYEIKQGCLKIFCQHRQASESEKAQLKALAMALVQFAMLLGGFGKSWRRVEHETFWRQYFDNPSKRSIGCHWEFVGDSEDFLQLKNLEEVSQIIDNAIAQVKAWAQTQNNAILDRNRAQNWREAWYRDAIQGVRVWGRVARDEEDSQAVPWFHDDSKNPPFIKKKLAGEMGRTGNIWHRMYPHYESDRPNRKGDYIELLTVFSDASSKLQNHLSESQKFLRFLDDCTEFTQLW